MRTPLQRAADDVRNANRDLYGVGLLPPPRQPGQRPVEPPVLSPPISVEGLSAVELRYQWERLRCYTAAGVFRRWLFAYVAWIGVPLDNVLGTCELLGAYVEASLLARVEWPHLAPVGDEDDDEPVRGFTEDDAEEMGLSIVTVRKPCRPKGTLPGCATPDCPRLRRPGEQWCPACARKMIEKWRSESD